jgi:hypothetical protein
MSKFEEFIINNSNEKEFLDTEKVALNQPGCYQESNDILGGLNMKIELNNMTMSEKEEEIRAKEREIRDIKGDCDKPGCASYLANKQLQKEKNLLERELAEIKEKGKKLKIDKDLFIEKN